ncbi:hypothetical protein [Streptomyces sp. CA-253872]|uniref:hypothetical protein n=1 Tax=Streptomyces sp. CA-253872 TaxID=3240067 RepID=UPI003D8A90E8
MAFSAYGERHPGVLLHADGFGLRLVLRDLAGELGGHEHVSARARPVHRHGPAP